MKMKEIERIEELMVYIYDKKFEDVRKKKKFVVLLFEDSSVITIESCKSQRQEFDLFLNVIRSRNRLGLSLCLVYSRKENIPKLIELENWGGNHYLEI